MPALPAGDCLYCQASDLQPWFSKTVNDADYSVCRCRSCGSAMVWPRPSQQEMDTYYRAANYGVPTLQEALYQDAGYYPDSRQDARRIIKRLLEYTPGKHFMDIGAGVGFFSLEAQRKGLAVTALEPNPNSAQGFARQLGFAPLQQVFDQDCAVAYEQTQDALLMSQVLEHISDLESLLSSLHQVLVPGGVAAIAVPHFGSVLSRIQGKRDMYISPPEHVNYFSVSGLNALFERHGFECIKVETVTKIPKKKLSLGLPGVVGGMAWRSAYGVLKLFEVVGRGMIINAYYRKR